MVVGRATASGSMEAPWYLSEAQRVRVSGSKVITPSGRSCFSCLYMVCMCMDGLR